MTKSTLHLSTKNKHIGYREWEIPEGNPLAQNYKALVWAIVVKASREAICDQCGKQSFVIISANPVHLFTCQGERKEMESDALTDEEREYIYSIRNQFEQILCSHHFQEKIAEKR